MSVPYENSFLHAINILWLQEPLIPHFLLSLSPDKSSHYVLVKGHTDAQCVCVRSVQAAAESPGEKFASTGLGSFFSL